MPKYKTRTAKLEYTIDKIRKLIVEDAAKQLGLKLDDYDWTIKTESMSRKTEVVFLSKQGDFFDGLRKGRHSFADNVGKE